MPFNGCKTTLHFPHRSRKRSRDCALFHDCFLHADLNACFSHVALYIILRLLFECRCMMRIAARLLLSFTRSSFVSLSYGRILQVRVWAAFWVGQDCSITLRARETQCKWGLTSSPEHGLGMIWAALQQHTLTPTQTHNTWHVVMTHSLVSTPALISHLNWCRSVLLPAYFFSFLFFSHLNWCRECFAACVVFFSPEPEGWQWLPSQTHALRCGSHS